jgi:serine/threonine protein kinase
MSSRAEYTNAVDIWGAGMIALLTLVGMASMDFAAILRYSAGAEKLHPDESLITQDISDDGRLLVRSLVQRNPSKRPSAPAALQHTWFSAATSQSHFKTVEDVSWSTTDTLQTSLPTARWTTAQSRPGSQDTIVPIQPPALQRGRPAARSSRIEVPQHAMPEHQFSYQSPEVHSDEGYGTNSGSILAMSQSDVRQHRSVTVKASIDRQLKKVELPLKDIDTDTFPSKVGACCSFYDE